MQPEDWPHAGAMGMVLTTSQPVAADAVQAVALLLNPLDETVTFELADYERQWDWHVAFASANDAPHHSPWQVPARSVVFLQRAE